MGNYNDNYLKVVSKMYAPSSDKLRYMRGVYMLGLKEKYKIVKEIGSDAAILYEYFYEKRTYNYFAPTNDVKIGEDIGWSKSKVTRIKSLLKKARLLLILKDTGKDGTIFYRTLLNSDLIDYYNEHNTLPTDLDIDFRDIAKTI